MILFANNKQTNEQFTDFIFTPNICQVYILNYGSNLLHIFPILFHFYVIDLQFCCTSQNFSGLENIYIFKKIDFLEKIQQFGTKIVEFDEQLFISFLFTNNEQFILLTNNEYSRTNKKHIHVPKKGSIVIFKRNGIICFPNSMISFLKVKMNLQ